MHSNIYILVYASWIPCLLMTTLSIKNYNKTKRILLVTFVVGFIVLGKEIH